MGMNEWPFMKPDGAVLQPPQRLETKIRISTKKE
jgi:hypothetical protein